MFGIFSGCCGTGYTAVVTGAQRGQGRPEGMRPGSVARSLGHNGEGDTVSDSQRVLPATLPPPSIPITEVSPPASLNWVSLSQSQREAWAQTGLVTTMVPEEGDEDIDIPLPNVSEALLPTIEGILSQKDWDDRLPNPLIENADRSPLSVAVVKQQINALHYMDALEVPCVKKMIQAARERYPKSIEPCLTPFVTDLSVFPFLSHDRFEIFVRDHDCTGFANVPLDVSLYAQKTEIGIEALNEETLRRICVLRELKPRVFFTLYLDGDISALYNWDGLASVHRLVLHNSKNTPPAFISRALADKVPAIDLGDCDLSNVDVSESLNGIHEINFGRARNIPPALISRALAASVQRIAVSGCDLSNVIVPASLAGIQALNLNGARNIPPELISRALADRVQRIEVSFCDLSGVVVPTSLAGIEVLNLNGARNVPHELISRALAARVRRIEMGGCDLSNVIVPASLAEIHALNLNGARNIPPELISRALADRVSFIYLRNCNLLGVQVPASLDGIHVELMDAFNIPLRLRPANTF